MNLSQNATSSVAASPPPVRAATPTPTLDVVPTPDVPFTSITGLRRVDEDGGIHWEICIGARQGIGIARGADFRSTLAEAMKELAQRKLSAVR